MGMYANWKEVMKSKEQIIGTYILGTENSVQTLQGGKTSEIKGT